MSNEFIRVPRRADICVKRISDRKPLYIPLDAFSYGDLDQTVYEIIGVVVKVMGKKVLVRYKTISPTDLPWSKRLGVTLSGYTLDGTDRTGTLWYWDPSQSGATAMKTVAISYNCTTAAALASTIQTALIATSDNEKLDFEAHADADGTIHITMNFLAWWYYNNGNGLNGTDGFTTAFENIHGMAWTDYFKMRRKNGTYNTNWGMLSSYERALTFWSKETNDTSQCLKAALTTAKLDRPVYLQEYLNTSTVHSDDYCKVLRDVYGEGDDGWERFMRSLCPPEYFGSGVLAFGEAYARKICNALGPMTYDTSLVTGQPLLPAIAYCYNLSGTTYDKGEFFLPTVNILYYLLGEGDTTSLSLMNSAALKIKGSTLPADRYCWSCVRCYRGAALYANGRWGCFSGNSLYGGSAAVPVSLYPIA